MVKKEVEAKSYIGATRCENLFGDCTDTFYCKLDDMFRSKTPCTYTEKGSCPKLSNESPAI